MKALLLVDLQNDYCEGGILEIRNSNVIISIANALMQHFDIVIATQDWHPANHGCFAANHLWRKPGQVIDLNGLPQTLWTMHCVQNSFGANLNKNLNTERITKLIKKGTDAEIGSYSAFFDNGKRKQTELKEYLQSKNIDMVYIMGLEIDMGVKNTALDALVLGYQTYLIEDACRDLYFTEGNIENTQAEMINKGVKLIHSTFILPS
jgi:nicotinamidase/pyrazinamidase